MMLLRDIVELNNPTVGTGLLSYLFCQATDLRINKAIAVLRGLVMHACRSAAISHLARMYEIHGSRLFEDANAGV